MFNGINQLTLFGVSLTRTCKRSVKLSYNATNICRNKSTVITDDKQSVVDFYAGKSVLVTGGTGFLGKIFIEKLLYSCSDIDKVYILIRDKKGQNTKDRLRQMLNNPVFDRLKKSRPQTLNKIVPIVGDISIPHLGISPQDEQTLADSVSVVFHSAATVKFFEPLNVAMNINFEGTRRMMDLSKRMKNLNNFVYISTAYSQSMYPVLEERVYPAPAEINDIYKFIEKHNLDKKKTIEFIGKHPHTYAFTKCLAENYASTSPDLPVTIVRPSLVGATLKEPTQGWLDNWMAMTGLAVDVARGLNHFCLGKPRNKCDLIPVDYVINLSLIAGAKHNGGSKALVYNSVSSGCNPVSWEFVLDKFIAESRKHKLCSNEPYYKYFESKFMYNLATLLYHKMPAYARDVLLRLKGEHPRYMTMLNRVLTTRYSIENFVNNDWTFKADAARALYASLCKADREEFPCDPVDINWNSYLEDYFTGVKLHLLPKQLAKEKAAMMPKSENKVLVN